MRALLLNDTSSVNHIGCELVVRNTYAQCRSQGVSITNTIPYEQALQAPELVAGHLKSHDLVLLNGEGTLHDDKPKALALLEATRMAKAAGLKTYLYNALWENNRKANDYLGHFDAIYCRDSSSQKAIAPFASACFVPDMVFATPVPDAPQPDLPANVLVTDSVKKKIAYALAKYAIKHRHRFEAMGIGFERCLKSHPFMAARLKRRCQYTPGKISSPDTFLRNVRDAQAVVTGRFHTACLSILCGTPVACVSSNTQKIESLFRDFGIPPALTPLDQLSPETAQQQWDAQQSRQSEIQSRVTRARSEIEAMFATMCA